MQCHVPARKCFQFPKGRDISQSPTHKKKHLPPTTACSFQVQYSSFPGHGVHLVFPVPDSDGWRSFGIASCKSGDSCTSTCKSSRYPWCSKCPTGWWVQTISNIIEKYGQLTIPGRKIRDMFETVSQRMFLIDPLNAPGSAAKH